VATSEGSLDATILSVALSGETGPAGTRVRVRVGRRSVLLFSCECGDKARGCAPRRAGHCCCHGDRSGEGRFTPDPAISDPRGPAPPGAFSAGLTGSQSRPQFRPTTPIGKLQFSKGPSLGGGHGVLLLPPGRLFSRSFPVSTGGHRLAADWRSQRGFPGVLVSPGTPPWEPRAGELVSSRSGIFSRELKGETT